MNKTKMLLSKGVVILSAIITGMHPVRTGLKDKPRFRPGLNEGSGYSVYKLLQRGCDFTQMQQNVCFVSLP